MKVIPFFETTEPRRFIDCRTSALRDYFRYYGIPFNSYDAFILGETISCYSIRFQVSQKVPIPMQIFVAGTFEPEKSMFHNLGLPYREKVFSEENWEEEIQKRIDNSEPVIAVIDIRQITKELLPTSKTKFDIHCLSSMLICGYDKENHTYYLDLKEEKNVGGITVSKQALKRAINSNTFPLTAGRRYMETTILPSDKERIQKEYRISILCALAHTCETMLSGGYNLFEHVDVPEMISTNIGYDALQDFIKLLEEYKIFFQKAEAVLDSKVRERLLAMAFNIMRQFLMSGSNLCYRQEFGESLIYFAQKFSIPEFKLLGEQFVEISKQWRNMTRMLYNFTEKKGNETEYIRKLSEYAVEIYKQEHSLFENLLDIIHNYGK